MDLQNLPLGKSAPIHSLSAEEPMRQRLFDMGFTPGTSITPLYQSPSGDPRAYLIRGAVIALRSEDAEKILVKTETDRRD